MPNHQKLSDFILELLGDREKQKKYKKDRHGYIDASKLDPVHKQLLKSDDLQGVQDVVSKERPGAVAMRIFAIW